MIRKTIVLNQEKIPRCEEKFESPNILLQYYENKPNCELLSSFFMVFCLEIKLIFSKFITYRKIK